MSQTSRSGFIPSQSREEAKALDPFDVLRLVSATQPRSADRRFGGGVMRYREFKSPQTMVGFARQLIELLSRGYSVGQASRLSLTFDSQAGA